MNVANFKVGVDTVIFSVDTVQNRLLVLLVQRKNGPFLEQWSLPGTFVRQGESLEEAADRVLSEKIQVQDLYLEQLYSFDGPYRDLCSSKLTSDVRYLSVSYFALVRHDSAMLLESESAPLAWHSVHSVRQLAFDHDTILKYGHSRLLSKLEYSPIVFDILPQEFTLNELFQVYCTILGKSFSDYSNFRSRLLKLGFLLDTGQKITRGAGRPATLYQFDSEAFAPLQDKPFVFI